MDNLTEEETAGSFNSVVSWLVDIKERRPNNSAYVWSKSDIAHIKLGFSFMTKQQRSAFLEKYRDYQITKILLLETND